MRGRLAQLLPPDRWSALLAASNLDELDTLLRRSNYQAALARVNEQIPQPERTEQALRAHLAASSRTPLKLMQGQPRKLLDWLWRRFELDNLKTVLRTVTLELPPPQIRAALVPLGPASDLPWPALSEAVSLVEIVEHLASTYHGTFYARALEPALDRYRREGDLFVLEVVLDLAYYRRLLRLVDKLSGRDRAEAERFVGTWVDSQNLLWAFRYRHFFDLSPEEILNYTLQRRLRVDASRVRQIAGGAAPLDIVRPLWGERLPGLEQLARLSPAAALPELELIFRRYLYGLARDALRGFPFHLGTILAFDTLLESEVQDLITLVEGQVAGWPARRIQTHLIGSRA